MDLDYPNRCNEEKDLRPIQEIPLPLRAIFSEYPCFNVIQSQVLDAVLYTDDCLVISAPTGSGKTVIFELAIVRILMSSQDIQSSLFKIIYISPMKALCEERVIDWHKKFSNYGLSCISVTGDSDNLDLQSLANHNLIITTPEKWDSLTRRWKDNKKLVRTVMLFMIDEVHLLNEDNRGPTLEVIVSRMKTIEDSVPFVAGDHNEIKYSKIRFIALSATVPNVEDIAEWIGKPTNAKYFSFPEEIRPVKLKKIVLGYSYNKQTSYFKFDLFLNYKLQHLLMQHSMGKPTLIFCSTRKSTEMTAKHLVQNLTISLRVNQKSKLIEVAKQMTDKKVSEMLVFGVAYHHAGMLPATRHAVEELFRKSELPVLVTTSTLAMGVNLPAHLVIVKSTKCYIRGQFQDYSDTAILQMIGRAGRPQFDTSATALILTTLADKAKFEKMIDGAQPIESNLHRHLTEHLNAEVVLHTITGLDVALQWLSSTFLYIRARKNPRHYGLPTNLTPEQIDKKLLDMCQIEINKLVKARMLTLDHNIIISPTILGSLMAKYYIAFETMKLFAQMNGNEIMQQIIGVISKCHEFSEIYLRVDDKKCLNLLNKCQTRQTIRFPLKGKIKTVDMKVNCIIQAVLGCLDISDHSMLTEMYKIMRNGERITKCLVEYLQTREKCYAALLNATILAKCFHAQLWEDSQYVSKQLPGIGSALSSHLVTAGKTSFQAILNSSPRELEMIIKKKTPFGDNLIEKVQYLPCYEILLEFGSLEKEIELKLTITLKNAEDIRQKCTANLESMMCLLVGNDLNDVILYEKYSHSYLVENPAISKIIIVENADTAFVTANFVSEDWVGFDCSSTLRLQPENSTENNAKKTKANKTQAKSIKENNRALLDKFLSDCGQAQKVNLRRIKNVAQRKNNVQNSRVRNSQSEIIEYFTQNTDSSLQQVEKHIQHVSDNYRTSEKLDNFVKQSKNAYNPELVSNSDKNKDNPPFEMAENFLNQLKPANSEQNLDSNKNIIEGAEEDIQAFLNNLNSTFTQTFAGDRSQTLMNQNKDVNIDLINPLVKSNSIWTLKGNSSYNTSNKVQKTSKSSTLDFFPTDFNNEELFDDSILNSQVSRILRSFETNNNSKEYCRSHDQIKTSTEKVAHNSDKNMSMENSNHNEKIHYHSQTTPITIDLPSANQQAGNINISGVHASNPAIQNIKYPGTPYKSGGSRNSQLVQNSSQMFAQDNLINDSVLNSQLSKICEKYFKNRSTSSQKKEGNNQGLSKRMQSPLSKNSKRIDIQKFRHTPGKKFSHSCNGTSVDTERNQPEAEVMYQITEELHPMKKQRFVQRNNTQGSDEIMMNLERYIQDNTKRNVVDENVFKRNANASKSITWRSPLIYSPPVKFSPNLPLMRHRLSNSDLEQDSSNEKPNDSLETSASSRSVLPSEPHCFKTPRKTRIHTPTDKLNISKQRPHFPLSDNSHREPTNNNNLSHISQSNINDSFASRDNETVSMSNLQELCSSSFLDNLGLLRKEQQQKPVNTSQVPSKQTSQIANPSRIEYYTELLKKQPQENDSGISSHSKNLTNTPQQGSINNEIISKSKSNSQIHRSSQLAKPHQPLTYIENQSSFPTDSSYFEQEKDTLFQHQGYNSGVNNLNSTSNPTHQSGIFSNCSYNVRHSDSNQNFNSRPLHFNANSSRNIIVPPDEGNTPNKFRNNFLSSSGSSYTPWNNPNRSRVFRSVENSPALNIASSESRTIRKKCRNQNSGFTLCENGRCSCSRERYSKENVLTQERPPCSYYAHDNPLDETYRGRNSVSCVGNPGSQYQYNNFGYQASDNMRSMNSHCLNVSFRGSKSMKSQCCGSSQSQMPKQLFNVSGQQVFNNSRSPRSRSMMALDVSDNESCNSSGHLQTPFSGRFKEGDFINNSLPYRSFNGAQSKWNYNSGPFDNTQNYRSRQQCNNRVYNSQNFCGNNIPVHGNFSIPYRDNKNTGVHSSDCNSCCEKTMFENNVLPFNIQHPQVFPQFGYRDNMNEDQMLEQYYSHYNGDKQYVMNKFFDSLEHEQPDTAPFNDQHTNVHGNAGRYFHS